MADPALLAIDANLETPTIKTIIENCYDRRIPSKMSPDYSYTIPHTLLVAWYEPTSVSKSTKIMDAIQAIFTRDEGNGDYRALLHPAPVSFVSPNILELTQLFTEAKDDRRKLVDSTRWWSTLDAFDVSANFHSDLARLSRLSVSDTPQGKEQTLSFIVQDGIAQMAVHLLPFFQHLVIKCGDKGEYNQAILTDTSPKPYLTQV